MLVWVKLGFISNWKYAYFLISVYSFQIKDFMRFSEMLIMEPRLSRVNSLKFKQAGIKIDELIKKWVNPQMRSVKGRKGSLTQET